MKARREMLKKKHIQERDPGIDYHGATKIFNFGSVMEMTWKAKMNAEIEIIGRANILPKIMSIRDPQDEFSISRHDLFSSNNHCPYVNGKN